MSAKELLGVFVRLAGLASIIAGVVDFCYVVYYFVGKTVGIQSVSQIPLDRTVMAFLIFLAFGSAIIAGAKLIVRVAYWSGPDA